MAKRARKLPDPNTPEYEEARVIMVDYLKQIGHQDARNGYSEMSRSLSVGQLWEVPAWVALGLIAEVMIERDGLRPP